MTKITAEMIANYIINTYDQTFFANDEEYFITYDSETGSFGKGDIEARAHVDYMDEYLNDENPQRFFDETETIENKDFMKVCEVLANELNEQL